MRALLLVQRMRAHICHRRRLAMASVLPSTEVFSRGTQALAALRQLWLSQCIDGARVQMLALCGDVCARQAAAAAAATQKRRRQTSLQWQ